MPVQGCATQLRDPASDSCRQDTWSHLTRGFLFRRRRQPAEPGKTRLNLVNYPALKGEA